MNQKRPTPESSVGKNRRKRAAPTIDLKATEVQPQTAAGDAPPQEPVQETPAAQEPHAPERSERANAAPEQPAPRREPAQAASGPADEARSGSGFKMPVAVLAAGVAGALAMSLVLAGLWLTGLLPFSDSGSTAASLRLTALEKQLQEIQKRPVPANDSKAVVALTARVARMEDSIKTIPASDPELVKRVAEADNAMKSLGVALTALNRRSDDIAANTVQARGRAEAAEKAVTDLRASMQDISKAVTTSASSAELESLQQRIAALEQSVKAARAEIAKVAVTASTPDTSARLALSAAVLRDAVLRGAPFADELAQAKSLGADEKTLAPIAPFAASGVPNEKALAHELSALLPGMLKASGAPAPSGSFIERLQANAGQIVRIRPLDAPSGDDASTVLTRIEIAAANGDLAAALTDLGKLSDAQRAPAQAWIAKAKNRQIALAAAHQFAADTARALGSK